MGKKIIILLSLLVLLIFYTVFTFNYKTILEKDGTVQINNPSLNEKSFMDKLASFKDNILNIFSSKKSDEIPNIFPQQTNNTTINNNQKISENKNSVEIKNENKIENTQNVSEKEEIVEEKVSQEVSKDTLQKIINEVLNKDKITFKRRSTNLTQNSQKVIEEIAKILKENKNFYIEVAGHTDSRGSASLNKRISQKRADSVKNQLVKFGIKKSRLKSVGYGEDFPIAKDDADGLSEINRRVEINVTGEKK